jgi:hypothetical protein
MNRIFQGMWPEILPTREVGALAPAMHLSFFRQPEMRAASGTPFSRPGQNAQVGKASMGRFLNDFWQKITSHQVIDN